MKIFLAAFLASAGIFISSAAIAAQSGGDAGARPNTPPAATAPTDEAAQIKAFVDSLTPHSGDISLAQANATLKVGGDYSFYDEKDARRILEEAWGNPPDASDGVLGLIMPAKSTPFDQNAWAATITYLDDGYVTDADAAKIDYDGLLSSMKKDTAASNAQRVKQGYQPVELIGWAEQPSYDPESHKLFWARELKFGDGEAHTLNYDIRVLGRRGVLVIGFIAGMSDLAAIKNSAPDVLAMANFDKGATYAEYERGRDKKAAYGLIGLIAGAAIAQKTGLLAAALLFAKKFIALIIAGFAGLAASVRRFFSKK